MKPIVNMQKALETFHAAASAANAKYTERATGLESFRGSEGYDSGVRDAQQERTIAFMDAKNAAYSSLNDAFQAAGEKLEKLAASAAAPTQDELNTITALKLLTKPTEANIRDAVAVVKNPICIAALREIMVANQIMGVKLPDTGLTAATAKDMVQRIYNAVRESISETTPGESAGDMISNRHYMAFNLKNDFESLEAFVSTATRDPDLTECKALISMIDGTTYNDGSTSGKINGEKSTEPSAAAIAARELSAANATRKSMFSADIPNTVVASDTYKENA